MGFWSNLFSGWGGGGEDAADIAANQARARRLAELARERRIVSGTEKIDSIFSQYDDPFFEGIKTDFLDFTTPQLDRQYSDARSDLALALSRAGQGSSSTAGKKFGQLKRDYDLQNQNLIGQAFDRVNQKRSDIEASRGNLLNQLNATADPGAAETGATRQAGILSERRSVQPLGQLFKDVTEGIAMADAGFRKTSGGAKGGLYQNIFGGGSGRVV